MVRLSCMEDKRAENERDDNGKDTEYRHERHASVPYVRMHDSRHFIQPALPTGSNSIAGLETASRLHRRISVGILWNSKRVDGNRELRIPRAGPV
jgi:hypothetical protein